MVVEQLPARVGEFANYLNDLMARLDQGGGWCGVFWQRDPDGMRACLDGREVPPWDVVEALLQDLAARYGAPAVQAEAERARALHTAALFAYDARPGGRDALGDRLDVMLREQRYAVERQAHLNRALTNASTQDEADALRLDLAWAQDDHARATARCAELRARMAELDRRAMPGQAAVPMAERGADRTGYATGAWVPAQGAPSGAGRPSGPDVSAGPGHSWATDAEAEPGGAPTAEAATRPYAPQARQAPHAIPTQQAPQPMPTRQAPQNQQAPQPMPTRQAPQNPQAPQPMPTQQAPQATHTSNSPQTTAPDPTPTTPPRTDPPPPPAPKPRKRRRGSARFAGIEEEAPPVVVPPTPAPVVAEAASAGRATPRGARFAGAAEAVEEAAPRAEELDGADRREIVDAVGRLMRLRREGRSGEAHALLAEITYSAAARFPLLAVELQRAGLGADWATLLWEAASLPADRLVAAADALAAAGRDADAEQILRQGVARPAEEIGRALLDLAEQGRRREIAALLDVYVRVRTPEEAARSVAEDPHTLVPWLLEAARGVSEERHWDLVHALRVAGFAA
nr:hypothetical protein SBE_005124 [Streptomyces sp. SBE_14.2]